MIWVYDFDDGFHYESIFVLLPDALERLVSLHGGVVVNYRRRETHERR